jgi:hypothetical protein
MRSASAVAAFFFVILLIGKKHLQVYRLDHSLKIYPIFESGFFDLVQFMLGVQSLLAPMSTFG